MVSQPIPVQNNMSQMILEEEIIYLHVGMMILLWVQNECSRDHDSQPVDGVSHHLVEAATLS